jgi:hypothetical protein
MTDLVEAPPAGYFDERVCKVSMHLTLDVFNL